MYFCLLLVLVSGQLQGGESITPFSLTNNEFIKIGDEKKIPENVVASLAQDSQGYLWIGTAAGIVRYDGYRFRLFTHDTQKNKSLGGNFIRDILPLSDGSIWISTEPGGVSIFNPLTEDFEHIFDHQQLLQHPYLSSVSTIVQDGSGEIWLGTKSGVVKINPLNKAQIQSFNQEQNQLLHNDVRALLIDKTGQLWVGSRGGLNKYNSADQQFQAIFAAPDEALATKFIRSLYQDEMGRIWIGTDKDGVYILNPEKMTLQPAMQGIPLKDNSSAVFAITQADKNEMWIGRFGGIDRVDMLTGEWLNRIVPDPSDPNSLANNDIRALLKDNAGMMWVAGYGGGLQRHQQNYNGLNVLRYSILKPNLLSDPNISSVLETQSGQIWIGTRGNGIDIYDIENGVIGGYRSKSGVTGALQAGWITAMTQDIEGKIWVGVNPGKLYRFDPRSQIFEPFNTERGLISANIRVLKPAANGGIWIGTNQGLAKWSASTNTISMIGLSDDNPFREGINAIQEDQLGNLWVATGATGLYKMAHGTEILQHINGTIDHKLDLRTTSILGMLIDSKQRFWLDTPDGLLTITQWHSAGDVELSNISRQMGYEGRPLGANMLEDKSGRIWSQNFIFTPDEKKIIELQRADGNDIGTPWFRSFTKTRNGTLLFGGSKGLLMIEPEKFVTWQFQPPLVATELRINGKSAKLARLSEGLSLKTNEQSFSIEFAALDLSEPESNQYSYRLSGFDRDWITTDSSRRSASYSNLWPGDYILQVRGTNRNGNWSEDELAIKVKVPAKFWQSLWFLILVLTLGILFIYIAIGLRTKLILQRARELEDLIAERTQELQSTQNSLIEQEKMASLGSLVAGISHEINTPIGIAVTAASTLEDASSELLTLVNNEKLTRSGLVKYLAHIEESVKLLISSLERARQLIGSFKQVAVDQSSENRRKTELKTFFLDAHFALQALLKQRNCQLEISCPDQIILDTYPGALFQIISNLVSNSIIHGFPDNFSGKINIKVVASKDTINIEYSDNGIGMSEEVQKRAFEPFFTTKRGTGGSGLGLHLVYNFVTQLLGGEIKLYAKQTAGFSCCLTLPRVAPEPLNNKLYTID
jgi:ligand-binding sensor domain-containing protein/signal transduction histidine kinase